MKNIGEKNRGVFQGKLLYGFLFSVILCTCTIMGSSIEKNGNVYFTPGLLIGIIVPAILCTVPFSLAMVLLERVANSALIKRKKEGESIWSKPGRKRFFLFWAIGVIIWIPALCASWPGIFSYDAEAILYMSFTDKYSLYQPLIQEILFGGLLGGCYKIFGNYNVGIAFYTIGQILFVSYCYAYSFDAMDKMRFPRKILIAAAVITALSPTIALLVCCSTKDVPVAAATMVLTVLFFQLEKEGDQFFRKWGNILLMMGMSWIILLFRNNAIYAFLLFAVIWVLTHRQDRGRTILLFATCIALYLGSNQIMTAATNAKPGPIAEYFCVPMQQLARVYTEKKEELSTQEQGVLYSLIPEVILDQYHPKLADHVKINFLADNFRADPKPYISLWWKLFLRYPEIYINSFLENTYGYWYVDTVIDGYEGIWDGGKQYGESSYFAYVTENPGVHVTKFPLLDKLFDEISYGMGLWNLPLVLSMWFTPGFWNMVVLFILFRHMAYHRGRVLLPLAFSGFYFCTILLGPIALVRYVAYLFFMIPLWIALLFSYPYATGDAE